MEMVRPVISSQNAVVVNDRVRHGQELRRMPQAPRSSSVRSFRMIIFNSPGAALTTELNHVPGVMLWRLPPPQRGSFAVG